MKLHILPVIIACFAVINDFVKAKTHQMKFHIDGKVKIAGVEADGDENWSQETKIVVDDGQYIGIPK